MRKQLLVAGFLAVALASQAARADNYVSDQAAALVVWPVILSSSDPASLDTLIQLSNTSTQLAAVQCYYVKATGRCSVSGAECLAGGKEFLVPPCPSPFDLCIPQWIETDFKIYITGRQPLAWRASQGLKASDLPLDGVAFRGPTGESNASSRVPPFQDPESIFAVGELKCYVVNSDGTPSDRNVLKGEATTIDPTVDPGDSAKYSALGFRAIQDAVNDDNKLILGGEGAEYNGCPEVLILNHFFDFGFNQSAPGEQAFNTFLTLEPCTQNFQTQVPSTVTAQYLVFNEFEQRFSTSAPVNCFYFSPISQIDTVNPERSIFSVFVSGTIAGQTRIRGVNGGLMGIAAESTADGLGNGGTDLFNLHYQGERETSDVVTVVR